MQDIERKLSIYILPLIWRIYIMKNNTMKNLTKSMTAIGEMLNVIGTL